ncbi:MAG: hypothetical protein IPM51_03945 [Sphingobacteriaceae bacterium]|nr:hypothetical protein [Sphingobacteriaceae bacterium]
MKKIIFLFIGISFTSFLFAQKSKVQSAWRALSDYEATEKDGKPDLSYLKKANDAIDVALTHPDTKFQGKAHAYKARIAYAYYKNELNAEKKKLEASIHDKGERDVTAYGNTPLNNFEIAANEVTAIADIDAKYMTGITDGLTKGTASMNEDDIRFLLLIQQLKMESGNIAQGKYKAKKYDDAADYFYKTAGINSIILKNHDTTNYYNACVSASKSRNSARIIEYNKKMVDLNIANGYNFESLFNAYLSKGDSAVAVQTLEKGRQQLPNDAGLMNLETNYYLSAGKHTKALENLKASLDKDPNNPLLNIVTGNIYDNLANPKDKISGKELEKPAQFEVYFKNAETHYLKAIEFAGTNKDLEYNALYNTGAMYNNYGGYIQNRKAEKITDQVKIQKENEAKSQEYYKKAIPYLEKALEIKPDDKSTMVALRKLYLLTGNDAKSKQINEKIKSSN